MMGHVGRSIAIVSLMVLCGATAVAQASDEAFKAAYSAAVAANKKAGELKNQWTTTASSLAQARKAADAGNYARATQLAQQAEALANASIAQSAQERELWKHSQIQ